RPAAFDGIEQRCFFSADITPTANDQLNIERKLLPQNPLAQNAFVTRLRERLPHDFACLLVFLTQIDVSLRTTDRISGNSHRFNQAVRNIFNQIPINVSSWISFIGVRNDKFLESTLCRNSAPFLSGWKAGTSASP